MSDELAADLYKILKKEYELYQSLKQSAEKKKDSIIEGEVDDLAQLVEKEEEIVNKLEKKEKKREKVLQELIEIKGVDLKKISFKEMLKYFSEKWQDDLATYRSKLLEIIEELEALNEENRSLLEEAMKFNNFSLNMLYDAIDLSSQTYSKDKSSEKKQGFNIIDRKA
ncbi:MAG: flagellar protein FlgN [Bacillota bacterium]